jgi:hypothetical protein
MLLILLLLLLLISLLLLAGIANVAVVAFITTDIGVGFANDVDAIVAAAFCLVVVDAFDATIVAVIGAIVAYAVAT